VKAFDNRKKKRGDKRAEKGLARVREGHTESPRRWWNGPEEGLLGKEESLKKQKGDEKYLITTPNGRKKPGRKTSKFGNWGNPFAKETRGARSLKGQASWVGVAVCRSKKATRVPGTYPFLTR